MTPVFYYKGSKLFIESVPLSAIVEKWGTPCYVYSEQAIRQRYERLTTSLDPLPHSICYAVKANSNLALLQILAKLGAGFDIVSQGELERVLKAGGSPQKMVFSGVGKTEAEIIRALEVNIHCFNVESLAELERINKLAEHLNTKARIAIRLNPHIKVETHPYIATSFKENKFGLEEKTALQAYQEANALKHLEIVGIACHLGSQLLSLEPFLESCDAVLSIAHTLSSMGISLQHLDLGGGLGVCYQQEQPPTLETYAAALQKKLLGCPYQILLEPGRALIAEAGALLTRCEYIKKTDFKQFAIVDAGMNDLLRPALYSAWHEILPLEKQEGSAEQYDIVGPLCESGDYLGQDRILTSLNPGDHLAILTAGAYGFAMSSQYNSRPRTAEILVNQTNHTCIRRRESFNDLWANESLIDLT